MSIGIRRLFGITEYLDQIEEKIIEILVGTKINEAHQDPNLPVDLELRRNIVKRIAEALRNRYMKEVRITFV